MRTLALALAAAISASFVPTYGDAAGPHVANEPSEASPLGTLESPMIVVDPQPSAVRVDPVLIDLDHVQWREPPSAAALESRAPLLVTGAALWLSLLAGCFYWWKRNIVHVQ
ncbi:MAG: hypothetical protein GXY83_10390 [Rhodopirellula sp.]|nr:hypothetical protein [Rhodopirellula sp.]